MNKKVFMLILLICCLPLCSQANTVSVTFSVVMPNPVQVSLNQVDATSTTPDTNITTEETVINGIPVLIQTALAK